MQGLWFAERSLRNRNKTFLVCQIRQIENYPAPLEKKKKSDLTSLLFTPSDLQCFDFSGERLEKSLGEINPMVEFMPHDASGSPFTLSHSSNFASTTPSPLTGDPLQYLLETLNKMPLINRDILAAPTMANTQRSPAKPFTISRSVGAKSTNAFSDAKSDYQIAMRHYEDVVNTLFKSFKTTYKKSYTSKREHETRKDIYRHNLR